MNKVTLLALLVLLSNLSFSQIIIKADKNESDNKEREINFVSESGSVKTILLENGLKVFVDIDKNRNDIWGAVVVKGGAKGDPADKTGIAHYFEHIMFKGTTQLGTSDYESEKPYLDSIQQMYDLLELSDEETYRKGIFAKIDYYSQKAAKYAVPNEFALITDKMGGENLNAYTTFENIVYYNSFPAHNLNKWLHLNSHRLIDPVFRLFQKELATVYEEKNMKSDNVYIQVYEDVYKHFYPNSVYGKQTVLGGIEDLKSPSITKMATYYKNFYVANNMALILSGNIDIEILTKSLEKTFGKIRTGETPKLPQANENEFEGREIVVNRKTPVPLGIIGYRTVPKNSKDVEALKIIEKLLTNEYEMGLLDAKQKNNELIMAIAMNDFHSDIGGFFIGYIPKPFIQSINNGEKIVKSVIDSLKQGNYSDKLLSAVKNSLIIDFKRKLESGEGRMDLLIDCYMTGKDWSYIKTYEETIYSMSKSDLSRIASKYLGDNYLLYKSKPGFNKSTKLEKPDFTSVKYNPDELLNSEYAKFLEEVNSSEPIADIIRFNEDVEYKQLKFNMDLYRTENPYNDIFTLTFEYGVGTYKTPELKQLAQYLNNAGTKKLNHLEFKRELLKIGSKINFDVNNSYFTIEIEGFDNKLKETLSYLNELLQNTERDEDILGLLKNYKRIDNKLAKHDFEYKSYILDTYAKYGGNSKFLKQLSKREIKKLEVDNLLNELKNVLKYKLNIHYVGRKSLETVNEEITNNLKISSKLSNTTSPVVLPLRKSFENKIFLLSDKKARQSYINITSGTGLMNEFNRAMIKPFNKYFGMGINSLIFRKLREENSIAYSVYSYIWAPASFTKPGELNTFINTSSAKTTTALNIYYNILREHKSSRIYIKNVKEWLRNNNTMPIANFRNKSQYVEYWRRQGYHDDPRLKYRRYYEKFSSEMLEVLYKQKIESKHLLIGILGNKKAIDFKFVGFEYELNKVKLKDIYNK